MWTLDHGAAAAAARVGHVDLVRWQAGLSELLTQLGGRFARRETRAHAGLFVRGLLAGLPRTNCWTIAEQVGHTSPDALQHLLAQAVRDTDGVRDDLRAYVVRQLGAGDRDRDRAGGDVLMIDETGELTKGRHTVGVTRQYTGTAARIDNSHVAVYLAFAGAHGHAFLDRELYLPQAWTEDADRCAAAGVPDEVKFAPKPALAQAMLKWALKVGVRVGFLVGDEVYGNDPALRQYGRENGLGYVLAIARDHRVATGIGVRRAVALAARGALAWHRVSAGQGTKGHRWYDWALIDLADGDRDHDDHGGQHALLIRRSSSGELAFSRTWTAQPAPLAALVGVAGRRWAIEESIQTGKGLAALDTHQVRRWTSWRRWTVLAMLAHAFLVVTAAAHRAQQPGDDPALTPLVPLTCAEVRHLLATITIQSIQDLAHRLTWSCYRRASAARARTSHYARQAATLA